MKAFLCGLFLFFAALSLHLSKGEDIRLDNLTPEEARKIIDSQDDSLKFAPKIASNVPAVRILGKTPTKVLEDIYLANQYHVQDGLGSYVYGYSVPDMAKSQRVQGGGQAQSRSTYVSGQSFYSGGGNTYDQGTWRYEPTAEEKGPPRGFFYSFDYPVWITVSIQGTA